MNSATLNIRTSPRRMLTSRDAAEYCGIPSRHFSTQCSVQPMQMPNGSQLYDIRDLDGWLDSLKQNAPNSDDEIIGRLAG